jgi:hypothetical protein
MCRIFYCLSLLLLFSIVIYGQKKNVTNFDLEKFRQQRLKSEADYDAKVVRGELPTRRELAEREQNREKNLAARAARAAVEAAQNENYYQSQASVLRGQIADIEAQIAVVANQISAIPAPQVYYSVGYLPYFNNCCFGGGFPVGANLQQPAAPIAVVEPPRQARAAIRVQINPQVFTPNFNFGGIPYQQGILTVPFTLPTAANLTREELLSRLRTLQQIRAGLAARFDLLQDEARRNGVKID